MYPSSGPLIVIISLTVQVVTKNNSGKTAFALQPSISKALDSIAAGIS
jgi:hypothetical protein